MGWPLTAGAAIRYLTRARPVRAPKTKYSASASRTMSATQFKIASPVGTDESSGKGDFSASRTAAAHRLGKSSLSRGALGRREREEAPRSARLRGALQA